MGLFRGHPNLRREPQVKAASPELEPGDKDQGGLGHPRQLEEGQVKLRVVSTCDPAAWLGLGMSLEVEHFLALGSRP